MHWPWRGVAPALLAVVGAAVPAAAHPHVFIDYAETILCDARGVNGVRMSWTFDEMYSASLFHDYTSRPHGPLGAADIAELQAKAFADTAEEHYFADLRLNGEALAVKAVKDFDASYDGRKMTYRFTVPISVTPTRDATILEIASFDTEFYIDFELVKHDPVKIQHAGKLKLACAPKTASRMTTIFGPIDTVIVRCSYGGTT